ncbi:hypothetical protein HD806DRAFT_550336 [Xylariaceae sp. AK1471]|nr:hypothetical protein HD806DRAFT_550336 [Xylariaceae sp. AK1471]
MAVNYGLDMNRKPQARLAVPYWAEDKPLMHSEFSHPDVVIILTLLSYYYGGLSNADLFLAFARLIKSDQADLEYQAWVADGNELPPAFRQLSGVNMDDHVQFVSQIFPTFRANATVDYFLAHIVFSKEMKEFDHRLSASGWDIGETKTHPTTGFSGTNDVQEILPSNIIQPSLPDQAHMNALVLECLLGLENSVAMMRNTLVVENGAEASSTADKLLAMHRLIHFMTATNKDVVFKVEGEGRADLAGSIDMLTSESETAIWQNNASN